MKPLGHLLLFKAQLLVLVGLQVQPVHEVFKLCDSVLHLELVLQQLGLVRVRPVVVLSTEGLELLGLLS